MIQIFFHNLFLEATKTFTTLYNNILINKGYWTIATIEYQQCTLSQIILNKIMYLNHKFCTFYCLIWKCFFELRDYWPKLTSAYGEVLGPGVRPCAFLRSDGSRHRNRISVVAFEHISDHTLFHHHHRHHLHKIQHLHVYGCFSLIRTPILVSAYALTFDH